jgi:hypothetical protein
MAFCPKCGGIVDQQRKVCRECGAATSGAKSLIAETEETFTRDGPMMVERSPPKPQQAMVVERSPSKHQQQVSPSKQSSSPKADASPKRSGGGPGVLVSEDLGPPPPGVVVQDGRAYSTYKNGPGGKGAAKLCCGEIVSGRFCAQCGKSQA